MTPAFVRRCLLDPKHKIMKSYAPVMPGYAGRLTPKQMDALVAYVMTM